MNQYTTIKQASAHWLHLSGAAHINAANFARTYLAPLGRILPNGRAKEYPTHLLHAIYTVYALKDAKPKDAQENLASLFKLSEAPTSHLYTLTETPEKYTITDRNGNVIRSYSKTPQLSAQLHLESLNSQSQN